MIQTSETHRSRSRSGSIVSREDYQWSVKPTHLFRTQASTFRLFQYERGIVTGLTVWAADEAHALTKARNAIRAFRFRFGYERDSSGLFSRCAHHFGGHGGGLHPIQAKAREGRSMS
jgi:hypothetical protein